MPGKIYNTKYSTKEEIFFLHQFTIYKGKIISVNIVDYESDYSKPEFKIKYQIYFEKGEEFDHVFREESEVFSSREELIMSIK